MSEDRAPEENLADEFRTLGKNLLEALRSAWDAPERKRLSEELESNLNELSATLHREMADFRESPTGQRLKDDLEGLGEKVRSGAAESRVREELLAALRAANQELSKVAQRWSSTGETGNETQTPPSVDNPPTETGA